MIVGLVAGRMVLVVVFGMAAAGKLLDRAGSRRALAEFGIHERFTAAGALLLPLAELAVAGALLVRSWARLGAAGALALLVAFSVVVALNLAAGRRTECNCFGRLLASRIGAATLVRNGVLAALSVALILADGGSGSGDGAIRLELAAGLAAVALVAAAAAGSVVSATMRRKTPVVRRPASEEGLDGAGSHTTSLSRRRALGLAAMTIAAAALGFRPQATACGAECRTSADCPDTCPTCRKQPGYLQGHCH